MATPKKLKSGSWNIRVTIDGKQYSFTDPDKKTVKRMAAAFADECREAIDNPPLIEAIRKYIDDRAETCSPATLRGYRSIEKTLQAKFPALCQKRLVALTDRDIQTVINTMGKKTAKNYLGLIQPATGRKFNVSIPSGKQKEMRVPTDLEVLGLIRIFKGTDVEIPVMLGAFGGLRRGEICALTMGDLHGDVIHITKDMVLTPDGTWIVKPPKTLTSNRDVLLPHFVADRIRDKGRITALKPNEITNRLRRKMHSLEIDPPYCFHSLRHFSASYLHAQGVPDEYIMRRGGWASSSVMQNVYRHALSDKAIEMEQVAASAFQNPFQN